MSDHGKRDTVRSTGENAYFVASNSAKGFQNWYSECFDDPRIGWVYAIKGGPGTGKSRFLREIAVQADQAGWRVETIYCSSDPDSLDGIVLTREGREGIALLDATAPHLYEPMRPGYREEWIDLGVFWNAEKLHGERERLERLNRQKQEAYRRAYRYLSGYGEMSENLDELVAPYIQERAIVRAADRLMRDLPNGTRFSPRTALMRGVGMRGRVTLDTFFAQADKIFLIHDCHGSAAILLRELYRIAAQKQLEVRVSRDPVLPDRTDALYFPQSGRLFAALPEEACIAPHRTLSMRRFVDTHGMHRVRGSVCYAERVRRVMLTGATEELARAAEIHFRIEEIYESAMDFAKKECFTADFAERLLGGARTSDLGEA